MKKALSPLMASVMLIAFTMAVAALLGTWFTSMTKTETELIEEGAKKQINCTSALLDIVAVKCNSSGELKIAINNIGLNELYGFSIFAKINNTFYENSTGGPSLTSPLDPGGQVILTYYCSAVCIANATVETIRVSPSNCPQIWVEETPGVTCS